MKILVLRLSSIGDIVLTSPVLRCLKEQVKDVEVHVATKEVFQDMVRYSPHVSKVHVLRDELGELITELKKERFHQIIDLHRNVRTARIKRALGRPQHSFSKLNWEKWLLVNLKKDQLPPQHIVDRYMATVAHLGVKKDERGLDLFIPNDREVPSSDLPESHRQGFVAVAIGAAHYTKRLPPHRLVELCHLIEGPIVLIGGQEDRAVAQTIASAVGGRVFDATGRYDILGSASLIKQARMVVAHDSGAMHIACAFGKPVVSVWGNTVPAFGMGPYQPQRQENTHIMQVEGLPCRPCSKIGFDQCPQGHFRCMEQQDLKAIAELAKAGD